VGAAGWMSVGGAIGGWGSGVGGVGCVY